MSGKNNQSVISSLLEKECEAIAFCTAILDAVTNPHYWQAIAGFKQDHYNIFRDISALSAAQAGKQPDLTQDSCETRQGSYDMSSYTDDDMMEAVLSQLDDLIEIYDGCLKRSTTPGDAREVYAHNLQTLVSQKFWFNQEFSRPPQAA